MKNTGWLIFEKIFVMGVSLIVTSLMARYLGTADFGLLNYSLAYLMIFMTVSNLGIDDILVNEIVKNKEDIGKLIGTTMGLRFATSIFSILLLFFLIRFFDPSEFTLHLILLIQSISLIFAVLDSIEYWFQANLQSKYVVISKLIAFSIVSLWRLLLIYFVKQIHYFALATVIEAVVIGSLIVYFYIKFKGPKLCFSIQTAKYLLAKSIHFFVAAIFIIVYTQMDKIMLGQMANTTIVGIYSAAMAISGLWMFIPLALINSARPLIMASKEQDEGIYLLKNKQLYCSIIWFSILASCFIAIFAKPVVLLIYGESFIESVNVLVILIWSKTFALIGTIKAIWLTMENLGKYQVYFVGIAALLNVLFNLLLIPIFGAIGAAIATLIAEVLSSIFAILLFKKTRPLFSIIVEAFLFKGVKF